MLLEGLDFELNIYIFNLYYIWTLLGVWRERQMYLISLPETWEVDDWQLFFMSAPARW